MPETKNSVTTLSGGLALQDKLLSELDVAAKNMGQDFTDYGKKCVVNAIASIVIHCKSEGSDLTQFDSNLLRLALQNIGYTELNIAAIPSECYLDIRKGKDGKKMIAIKPQGAGNEKLLRTYGVGIKEVRNPWLIREGDDFAFPAYDGLNVIPPKWTPKSFDKKVIMVVYPVIKVDGSVEYLIATRESVKPNIVAHIRQNALYSPNKDTIYEELNKIADSVSVDDLLANEKFRKFINPTYLSAGSKEAMLLRKMKNNATKNYPKEYRDAYMADAVKNMFEDVDESLNEKPTDVVDAHVDPVEKVEEDIAAKPQGEPISDFDADGVKVESSDEESYGF